jgi:hypothetical protein
MENKTTKTWHFGKGGKLIIGGVPVANMDEARRMASRWNRDCAPGMQVEIIANSPIPAQSTEVTAVSA